jgi:hypothetical protein
MTQSHPIPASRSALPLVIVLVLAACLLLGLGGIFALIGILSYVQDRNAANAVSGLIVAGAFVTCGLLIAPSLYYNFRRMMGRAEDTQPTRLRLPGWTFLVAFGIWGSLLGAGSLLSQKIEATWLLMPFVAIPAAALPVFALAALALRGLPFGTPRRASSAFSLGLTVGPFIIAILEFGLIFVALLCAVIWIAAQPDLQRELLSLGTRIKSASEEEVLSLLLPWIAKPGVIVALLAGVAVAVPLIEEALKPIGMWLFARRVETPRDGFVLGTLSGAAYALFENLSAAANIQSDWPAVMLARVGTSALHVFTAGLIGWGLASALRERRYGRMLACYAAGVMIHGLWNGGAILFGVSALSALPGAGVGIPIHIGIAFGGGLVALTVGIVFLLGVNNRLMIRTLPLEEPGEIPAEPGEVTV